MSIKTVASKEIYRNRWLRLREDRIEYEDGAAGIYSVVEKPDFAIIIPVDTDRRRLHLVEQYRYPIGERRREFPQGTWEEQDAVDPATLAAGELREETGLTADAMDYLGRLHVAYGLANQGMHVFLATGLTPGPTERAPEEQDMVALDMTIDTFEAAIRAGDITDNASLAAYLLAKLKRPDIF